MGRYLRAMLPPEVHIQLKEPPVVVGAILKVLLTMGPTTEPEPFIMTVIIPWVPTDTWLTYLPPIETGKGRFAIALLCGKTPVLLQKSAM